MKRLLAGILLFTGLTSPVYAEDSSSLTGAASVSLASDYMWRGFNLYDGSSVQPSVSADYDTGYGKVGGNVWAHLSAEGGTTGIEKFTEVDYTLAYTNSYDAFTFKVGHIWYTFPKDSDNIDDSAEVFATVVIDDAALGCPFALTPTLSVYHDYDLVDGQYYELGISHTLSTDALGKGFSITPYAAFGFASDQTPLYAEDGFVQSTFGVSTTLNWGDITVTPSANFTAEADDNLNNEFWYGMNFGYSF